jgi:preprotein translocase subunit YajC
MTLGELLPLVAIAAVFWFLLIRPISVRRKAQAKLVAALAPGQHVMTTAGVFGTLVAIDGERVRVEVAPGVEIEMLAQALAQIVPGAAPADGAPDPLGAGASGAELPDVTTEPAQESAGEADRG